MEAPFNLSLPFLRVKLCFLYRLMVAAVPMLEFAAERSTGRLADYYAKHIAEETGHDTMMADDLARMGVVTIPHYFEAAMLAGAQYYVIAHDDPALLLGYMNVMEKNAPKVADVEQWQRAYGVRLDCLMHHAKVDPWHAEDLAREIAALDDEMRQRVQWNEANVLRMYQAAMRGIYADTLRGANGKRLAIAA